MTDSATYAYLGRWNYSLQEPVPDESWITEDQARAGLEAGGSVIEYIYPDDTRWYAQYDCAKLFHGIMKPDGTGFRTINDKSRPTVDLLSIDQIDVLSNWLGRPAFGDWHVLLDPDFGVLPTSPGTLSEQKPRRRLAWSPFRKR
ncbi:hypothetical protein [Microbacterium sp. NPDC087868]|uniref:hypothetical protein n=1 Tax=Microbacterium sp. NPDC087868 TaxID=3364195 RepID=UPI00384E0CE8